MDHKWHGPNGFDPYGALIEGWVSRSFPQVGTTQANLVDTLTDLFLATKQYRIGPKPNLESQVAIRSVIRSAIEAQAPINILIPAAAIKVPIGESLDLAELSVLRILQCLIERVSHHYAPGVFIRIRLEDLTEYVISDGTPDLGEHVEHYIDQFRGLNFALGLQRHIDLVPESDLVDSERFLAAAAGYRRVFRDHLEDVYSNPRRVQGSANALAHIGWNGGVSPEFAEFLDSRYRKLYPDLSFAQRLDAAAAYLSAILARRNLDATGRFPTGQLEISFAPPMPDAPEVSTRVYYRTVPLAESSNHMPFWNAKGHIRISEDGTARIALGRWDEEYNFGQLTINGVTIRADYALEN
jgi:hypothetical protein